MTRAANILLSLLLVSLASHAFAASAYVECRNVRASGTDGWGVTHFLLTGTITGEPDGAWTLNDYKGVYEIRQWVESGGIDDGYVWDFDVVKGEELANDRSYRPTKYEGHVRFRLPFNRRGRYDLIFPEFSDLAHDDLIEAYVIFSRVKGVFGTTASVACRVLHDPESYR